MEVTEVRSINPQPGGLQSPPVQGVGGGFTLPAARFSSEDILFCIDVGPETMVEMKVNGPNGRPYTRLDSIKQAIMLFVHAKLSINPDHRFAFAALSKTTYWHTVSPKWLKKQLVYASSYYGQSVSLLSPCHSISDATLIHKAHGFDFSFLLIVKLRKEFNSDVDSASAALRGVSVDPSPSQADLSQLFRVATHEAKKSRAQNRIFRLILIYCRSSMPPQYQLPSTLKLFTLDFLYLHDKPGPDNCPQMVYDTLVEALDEISEFEGYIFESGLGLTRALFRDMCKLLCHPQQRCNQDDLDLPKALIKKSPVADSSQGDDNAVVSTQ